MRDPAETTVLMTGATDDLGKRVALELARRGATVLLHGRSRERCGLWNLSEKLCGRLLDPLPRRQ